MEEGQGLLLPSLPSRPARGEPTSPALSECRRLKRVPLAQLSLAPLLPGAVCAGVGGDGGSRARSCGACGDGVRLTKQRFPRDAPPHLRRGLILVCNLNSPAVPGHCVHTITEPPASLQISLMRSRFRDRLGGEAGCPSPPTSPVTFDCSADVINTQRGAELHVQEVLAHHDPALPPKLPQNTLPSCLHLWVSSSKRSPSDGRGQSTTSAVTEVCTFGSLNAGAQTSTQHLQSLACTPRVTNKHVHS